MQRNADKTSNVVPAKTLTPFALTPAFALAFLLGCSAILMLAELPVWQWIYSLATIAMLLLVIVRRLRWLAIFALGFCWAVICANSVLHAQLTSPWLGSDVTVMGQVLGMPKSNAMGSRFELEIESMSLGEIKAHPDGVLRLSWYRDAPALLPGQLVELVVKLKQPRGTANLGGFDFERWALERRIIGQGYVRQSLGVSEAPLGLQKIRGALIEKFTTWFAANSATAVLRALAVGDQSALGERDWQVLRDTGTTHLVAVSGFHIGLIAGLGLLLARLLRRLPWQLPINAPMREALFALLLAVAYAALAGFSIPVQRALVMVLAALGATLLRRPRSGVQMLSLAIFAVLIYDPLAVLAPGFWLSFMGVFWLLFCFSGRREKSAAWKTLTHAQLAMFIALLPVTVLFFQQASLLAPLVNLIAIPWVSFLVVPVALLGIAILPVWPWAAEHLVGFAHTSSEGLIQILNFFAQFQSMVWPIREPGLFALSLSCLGVAILLLPRGVAGKGLGVLALLPLLLPNPAAPLKPSQFELTVFDVGQGLSLLVRTANHTMLYDTGAGTPDGFDFAEAAVIPAMQALGVNHIDTIVLSHGDNDHAGGYASIAKRFPAAKTWRGHAGGPGERCQAGQVWSWDEVEFTVLHPPIHFPDLGNDSSCVIRVSSKFGSLLLPGDIGSVLEQRLLSEYGEQLRSTILLSPHHGSKHSSSSEFLRRVGPDQVWISAGHENRYGHPAAEATARYAGQEITVFNTAETGMLQLLFSEARQAQAPMQFRQQQRRFWRQSNAPHLSKLASQ